MDKFKHVERVLFFCFFHFVTSLHSSEKDHDAERTNVSPILCVSRSLKRFIVSQTTRTRLLPDKTRSYNVLSSMACLRRRREVQSRRGRTRRQRPYPESTRNAHSFVISNAHNAKRSAMSFGKLFYAKHVRYR